MLLGLPVKGKKKCVWIMFKSNIEHTCSQHVERWAWGRLSSNRKENSERNRVRIHGWNAVWTRWTEVASGEPGWYLLIPRAENLGVHYKHILERSWRPACIQFLTIQWESESGRGKGRMTGLLGKYTSMWLPIRELTWFPKWKGFPSLARFVN